MTIIRLPAKLESLEPIMAAVSGFLNANGLPGNRIQEIELATEEALVNIFNYAYTGQESGEVEVRCHMAEQGRLIVEFRDRGVPFDVTALAAPDLNASLPERKVGGLGIFLMRKMVDEVLYRREEDHNILTFVLRTDRGE
ncbi:MAG: ATP-binding protein [Thermodesulfobacteriota bacterium]